MSDQDKAAVEVAQEPRSSDPGVVAANACGIFMASHNGGGYWTVFNQRTGDVIVNVIPHAPSGRPGEFGGDLGELNDVPLISTAHVDDLVATINMAKLAIAEGGWEAATDS